MKKILYTLLAVSIIFSSCKKEEGCTDPIASNYNSDAEEDDGSCVYDIFGGWDITKITNTYSSGYWTSYPNGQKITTQTGTETILPGDTAWGLSALNWNFKNDQKVIGTFTYTNGEVEVDTNTWGKSGNLLTIGSSENYTISTLSSSSLIFNWNESDTNTHYWDPMNDTVYFSENGGIAYWKRSTFTPNNSNSRITTPSKDSSSKSFLNRINKRRK